MYHHIMHQKGPHAARVVCVVCVGGRRAAASRSRPVTPALRLPAALSAPTDHHYSEQTAAQVVRGMLAALNYLHSKGVVHMDIGLSNFCFASALRKGDSLRVKLVDFGISKVHMPAPQWPASPARHNAFRIRTLAHTRTRAHTNHTPPLLYSIRPCATTATLRRSASKSAMTSRR